MQEQRALAVSNSGELVRMAVAGYIWMLECDEGRAMADAMREQAKDLKRRRNDQSRTTRCVGVLHDAASPNASTLVDGLAAGRGSWACWHDGREVFIEMPKARFGVCAEDALTIASWLRVHSSEARRNTTRV